MLMIMTMQRMWRADQPNKVMDLIGYINFFLFPTQILRLPLFSSFQDSPTVRIFLLKTLNWNEMKLSGGCIVARQSRM